VKHAAIAAGGMIGAVLRFWIGILLFQPQSQFPFPTLAINLIGSFILGWFIVYSSNRINNKTLILAIQTGFLGSFTTFSTFNAEIILLLDKRLLLTAVQYFLISAAAGIAAIILGMKCGSALLEKEGAEQ
jgi:fluoride exporter